ncbi:hypothetical protein TH66_03715 [Carbonactinospora thermoautotrophica]|uniref:Peptidyl-prolyl cis-trans isomerase n=1 Tax=Carbonactinospora thermoautotrophica TaxID=1469144 RepID=A0A132MSD2_9ACTN|nr:peptidylprolyl isomerase [Carbonactinospora thermoautotrophica]KWX00666.1 putative peptidyl-prolyl cis-trans isomerase B [Carbonactinospora thermoautotrophica]KWX05336.1 hypothetical protein TH66_03715 [Carbonactinospora thermoautotrophica]KWX07073.1 hypothetical protein TR74_19990 [Carbonactinospora thermoautotrophica]
MAKSKKREKELARLRYQRRQQRIAQARARARKRNRILAATTAVVLVIGGVAYLANALRGNDAEARAYGSASPTAPAPKGCEYVKEGTPAKDVGVPKFDQAEAAKPFTATIKTDHGDITFTALVDKAPCASYSFRYLAGKNFFDGTQCHRLTTTETLKVLQCGDPTGTGYGGPGYRFPDENLTGATYKAGTIAMANSGPDTNGSQFFIVYADSQLPPSYTPFGMVTAGLDVVRKVSKAGSDNSNRPGDGKPKTPVTISDVAIAMK